MTGQLCLCLSASLSLSTPPPPHLSLPFIPAMTGQLCLSLSLCLSLPLYHPPPPPLSPISRTLSLFFSPHPASPVPHKEGKRKVTRHCVSAADLFRHAGVSQGGSAETCWCISGLICSDMLVYLRADLFRPAGVSQGGSVQTCWCISGRVC